MAPAADPIGHDVPAILATLDASAAHLTAA
jgi:hypothetical protein